MNILVLDNYDSFVYNIVYILRELPKINVTIVKNDEIELSSVRNYDKVILSPGPGLPKDAGIMSELIAEYHNKIPILGICLGHQAIAEFFGSRIYNLLNPLHGLSSTSTILKSHYIFNNIPRQIKVGHYHSWVVKFESENLVLLAEDENKNCMAISHSVYDCVGLQFHPESILTEFGTKIIENWALQPISIKTLK